MSGTGDPPESAAPSPPSTMPVRTNSDESATGDPSDPLYARFKTWRGVLGNLLEYFEQLESFHKQKAKEYAKLSKMPEVPFKTPDFAPDGIALIWQAIRDKNLQLSNFHTEEAQILKAGTIAELGRLRSDLKKHLSDLEKEGVKGSRKVEKKMDKFSDLSQSLGKWIPVAETNPASLESNHDPYVLWRQTKYKLYLAVDEENVLNEQLLALQNRCQAYEKLVVNAIKKAIQDATDNVVKESQYHLTVANELNAIAIRVPPEREWENFARREPALLNPDGKPRDPSQVPFPFDNHPLVKPVLEATLDRKSTMLKRRHTATYVLTRSGFLLEYKDNDPIANPEPSLALKLVDCLLGPSPAKSGKAGFNIKGKDSGKMVGRTHEYAFRTDSMSVAEQWWAAIEKICGAGGDHTAFTGESPGSESPMTSPVSPSATKTTSATSPTTAASPTSAIPGTYETSWTTGTAEPETTATADTGPTAQPVHAAPGATPVPAPSHATTTAAPTATPNPSLAAAQAATKAAQPDPTV